jgi:hypothetical protein
VRRLPPAQLLLLLLLLPLRLQCLLLQQLLRWDCLQLCWNWQGLAAGKVGDIRQPHCHLQHSRRS